MADKVIITKMPSTASKTVPVRRMAEIAMLERLVRNGLVVEQDTEGRLQTRPRDKDEAPQRVHAGSREAQRRLRQDRNREAKKMRALAATKVNVGDLM